VILLNISTDLIGAFTGHGNICDKCFCKFSHPPCNEKVGELWNNEQLAILK
jgi:hypothetical protein